MQCMADYGILFLLHLMTIKTREMTYLRIATRQEPQVSQKSERSECSKTFFLSLKVPPATKAARGTV